MKHLILLLAEHNITFVLQGPAGTGTRTGSEPHNGTVKDADRARSRIMCDVLKGQFETVETLWA